MDHSQDDDEFRRFVEREAHRLGRLAWAVTNDADAVDDLVQAALVKTFTHWTRAQATDPYAYARAALLTTVIDERRRQQRWGRIAPLLRLDAVQPKDTDMDRVELRSDLVRAMQRLTIRQRTIVALRYLEDMSEADVARAVGVSLGTIKSTTSRALRLLRPSLSAPNRN